MDVLQKVLVELAVCGEGSLDFVTDLLHAMQNEDCLIAHKQLLEGHSHN